MFSLIGIIGFLIGLREIVVSQRRARDAEERRAAEQQAVEKSAILDATFQNMAQGIAVFDADHNLKTFNRQYGEILELPPDFLR
ncbi:MAG: hypothetical protein GWN87_14000, partial [Desulfuromonadales bacterium]|nr:hypothetical protein [Desulfuromonadales bacterium]